MVADSAEDVAADRGPQIANGRGGNDNVFAISTGGMVHVMNPQIGTDQIPPVKLLPPERERWRARFLVDTTLYAATTGNCSGRSERRRGRSIWRSEAKTVQSYDTKGAAVAGTAPPAFGTDGTLYIATGSGNSRSGERGRLARSKTLTQKDWFSATTAFTSNPVVFQYKGQGPGRRRK